MSVIPIFMRRLAKAGALLASFTVLTGCQGEKIVARVGSDSIKESEYYGRTLRMNAAGILEGTDAGGAAMVTIIREKMTAQLAAAKNALPTEEQLSRFVAYQMRLNSQVKAAIEKGLISEEEIKRGYRFQFEEIGIGTEGAKISEADARTEYDRLAKEKDYYPDPLNPSQMSLNPSKVPETWVVKFIPVQSEEFGNRLISEMKVTPDFIQAATKLGLPAQQAQAIAQERSFARQRLAAEIPSLEAALAPLSPGQITPKVVAVATPPTAQSATTQPTTSYIVAQVVRKDPEYLFKFEEARTAIEYNLLMQRNRDWFTHKEQQMADYTTKLTSNDAIKINLKQYQSLLDTFIKTAAKSSLSTAPGGTLAPQPSAPATGNQTPPVTPPQGAQPK